MTKEKPGTFFLFQMDHLPGEEVGSLVDTLYGWGAANVNVIPTLTKKSRPGHLVLVDAGGLGREALPGEMARLFGTCGHQGRGLDRHGSPALSQWSITVEDSSPGRVR